MNPKQLVANGEETYAKAQHRKPCADCPWSRTSLRGWTGTLTPVEWMQAAHREEHIVCHTTRIGTRLRSRAAECAGAAIYRANVCKLLRHPHAFVLPADKERVFASPAEFLAHHKSK